MGKSTPDEITTFLKQAKVLISQGKRRFLERDKNISSISNMGLTIEQAWAEILELTYREYLGGPELDDNPRYATKGHLWWMFGIEVSELQVYIKLRIAASNVVVCLSFHEAEYPLFCPYQDTR
jgi:hypothetical protein